MQEKYKNSKPRLYLGDNSYREFDHVIFSFNHGELHIPNRLESGLNQTQKMDYTLEDDDSDGSTGLIVGLTLSLVGNVVFIILFIVYIVKYKSAMSMIDKLQNPPNDDDFNDTE